VRRRTASGEQQLLERAVVWLDRPLRHLDKLRAKQSSNQVIRQSGNPTIE
jgi:hypothetical protein